MYRQTLMIDIIHTQEDKKVDISKIQELLLDEYSESYVDVREVNNVL